MSSRKELVENSLTAVDNIQHLVLRLQSELVILNQGICANSEIHKQARINATEYAFEIIERCVAVKLDMDELVFRR